MAQKAKNDAKPDKKADKNKKQNLDEVEHLTEAQLQALKEQAGEDSDADLDELEAGAGGGGGESPESMMPQLTADNINNTSLKNFRNHPDMENFYRFIYESDLRHEALQIVDQAIATKETYGVLAGRANILLEMGRKDEGFAAADKAIARGKTDKADTSALESRVAGLKGSK